MTTLYGIGLLAASLGMLLVAKVQLDTDAAARLKDMDKHFDARRLDLVAETAMRSPTNPFLLTLLCVGGGVGIGTSFNLIF